RTTRELSIWCSHLRSGASPRGCPGNGFADLLTQNRDENRRDLHRQFVEIADGRLRAWSVERVEHLERFEAEGANALWRAKDHIEEHTAEGCRKSRYPENRLARADFG